MKLTRKAFIVRAAAGTLAAVATTIAGSSAADAGPSPHMRPVNELLDAASRKLRSIQAAWTDPPEPNRPALVAELTEIRAQCDAIGAMTEELLARLR